MTFAPQPRRTPRVSTRALAGAGSAVAGAVLLEVILALVLFVAAAAVITSAVNSSLESVLRQKLNLHAVNLATTILSEVQLGQHALEAIGPEKFRPPFEEWTWQIVPSPRANRLLESEALTVIEVIVRHEDPPVVFRLAQAVQAPEETRTAALGQPAPGRKL